MIEPIMYLAIGFLEVSILFGLDDRATRWCCSTAQCG